MTTTPTPASQPADLTDAEIVAVLASLGHDAEPSKYDWNPVLQVRTTVPAIRDIVKAYRAAIAAKAQESAPSSEEIATWQERGKLVPHARPSTPSEMMMCAEIADLRAALARRATAGTTALTAVSAAFDPESMHPITEANAQVRAIAAVRGIAGTTAAPSVMTDRRAFEEWFNGTMYTEEAKEAMLIGWQARSATASTAAAPSSDMEADYAAWLKRSGALGPGTVPERIFFAGWSYGQRATAGNAAPTEAVTRLDVLSLIREHGHRCYVAGVNCAEVDPKYMAEIESALRSLASNTETAAPNVMDDRRAFHEWFNGTMYRSDAEEAMLIGWQASTADRTAATAAPGDLPPLPTWLTEGKGRLIPRADAISAAEQYGKTCRASNACGGPELASRAEQAAILGSENQCRDLLLEIAKDLAAPSNSPAGAKEKEL